MDDTGIDCRHDLRVVLLSGGIDSAVAMYLMRRQFRLTALGVNYGQPHAAELQRAKRLAAGAGVAYVEFDVSEAFRRTPCAMMDGGDVSTPEASIIPGRNMMLLRLARALGPARIIIGCNADDAQHYPDCTPEFIVWADKHLRCHVEAPLIGMTKREVVAKGRELGVPLAETLSCYRGTSCGQCAACKLRAEAGA